MKKPPFSRSKRKLHGKLLVTILLLGAWANSYSADNFNVLDITTFNGNTWSTGTGTLSIAAGKTLTASKTLTLTGTDGTTLTFPTTSATVARTDAAQTFTGAQTLTGQILQADGTSGSPSYSFSSSTNAGFWRNSTYGAVEFGSAGTRGGLFASSGIFIKGTGNLAWQSSDTASAGFDLFLFRDTAGVFAQRNGLSAQSHRIYNTFTDASNYERLGMNWSGNAATIQTEAAGTGTVRQLNIINPSIGASALTLTSGALGLSKMTASASAPGAAGGKMELVCGTNAGTAKLVISAGTSATTVTIVDNIGAGVTGC